MFLGFGLPFVMLFMMSASLSEYDNSLIIDGSLAVLIVAATTVLCFNDSAYSHAYTRQIKFLRRLRMTVVKPWHYIVTGIVARIGVLFLFTGVMVATLAIGFDMSLADRNWLLLIGTTALTFIMFYLIGMFVANMLKNAKMSQGLAMAVYFLLLVLGGIMFPIGNMPNILQPVANALPTAFSITTLQNAWMGMDILSGHYLLAMIGVTAVFGLLSVKFFKYE